MRKTKIIAAVSAPMPAQTRAPAPAWTSARLPARAPALAFLLALMLATACASAARTINKDGSAAPLRGMIYDLENRPVRDAEVALDGGPSVRSDINGRFMLGAASFGKHEVEIEKPAYEPASIAVDFDEEGTIVYAKLLSSRQLLSLAEKEADKRDWAEALVFLDRKEAVDARGLEEPDAAALYLRSVALFRRGRPEEARAILESLIAEGYDEAYARLFLADLLQFRLNDPVGARSHLEAFVSSRYDPDVERRLRSLRDGGREP
jgi:hypothetical protein